MFRVVDRLALAAGVFPFLTVGAFAQPSNSVTETKTFEVIAVKGNLLDVRLPEGIRELTVPEDFRFMVDGRPLSVHELQPGMKGTANITTRTTVTPVTVTEVKNGTVMQSGGSSIIVRTDDGIKMFSESDIEKRGVKLMRDGQPAQLSDFHTGDKLSATIVTTRPPQLLTEKQVEARLARGAAPANAAPAAEAATTSASSGAASTAARPAATAGTAAAAVPAASASAARQLPKTASELPLLALLGLAALLTAAVLRRRRLQR